MMNSSEIKNLFLDASKNDKIKISYNQGCE